MEKDMKFTTAGEWVNGDFQYDQSMSILENFNSWWSMNTEEREEWGAKPLSQVEAMNMFCTLLAGIAGLSPGMIIKEYEKAVDKSQ